jgi:hypothetical protein
MCDGSIDDDINFGKLGRMHSSVMTFKHRATWVLNQHPENSDDEVELQPPSSHETSPEL